MVATSSTTVATLIVCKKCALGESAPRSVLSARAPSPRVGNQRARLGDDFAVDFALGDLCQEMRCDQERNTTR